MIELPRSTTARRKTRSSSRQLKRFLRPVIDEQLSATAPETPKYFDYKYAVERVVAILLLIPAVPVILACGCLVGLTSRGPAIYRQQRVGKGGNVFSMLKIRTMVVDAESESGPSWSSKKDPRVTRVGRFLRFLHLDELPQLFNVIKGEMTIIGPRPERPDFVKVLSEFVDGYTDRLVVKPGITGLAQIYLPPDESIDCVRKKVCFDRAYIEAASPLVDLQIWFCTMVRILGIRHGHGPKWAGLDRRFHDATKKCAAIQVGSSDFHEDENEKSGLSNRLFPLDNNSNPRTTDFSVNGQSSSSGLKNGHSKKPK